MNRRGFFSFLVPVAAVAAQDSSDRVMVSSSYNGTSFKRIGRFRTIGECVCGFAPVHEGNPGERQTIRCFNPSCKQFDIKFDIPTVETFEAQ